MKRKLITLSRIIKTGAVNFVRNAWLAIAAIAVMVVTLTIILVSVLTNVTLSNTIAEITKRVDFSIYLKDEVTSAQANELLKQLDALPSVADTDYLTKKDALEQYRRDNKDNQELLSAINQTENPLPATIRIKPIDLNNVEEIRAFVEQPDIAALQSEQPSYSGDRKQAIDKIRDAANVLERVGVVSIALFAVVSVLIIFNTIQMAIFNRRDEINIMRLLGANTQYIRGPFVVESILYGVIAGVTSMLLVQAMFVASSRTLEATSFGLLDIKYSSEFFASNFWVLLGVQLALGVLIGAISSTIATHRYLKFKTSK